MSKIQYPNKGEVGSQTPFLFLRYGVDLIFTRMVWKDMESQRPCPLTTRFQESRVKCTWACFGFSLLWSYLSNISFSAALCNATSLPCQLTCGFPRGSILGPFLFTIYTLPPGQVFQSHDLLFQFYNNDTQLYMPLKPTDPCSLANVSSCISDLKFWMSHNFLKFNNKSKVILFSPPNLISSVGANLGDLSKYIKQAAQNQGMILDANLCFDNQFKNCIQFFLPSQDNC